MAGRSDACKAADISTSRIQYIVVFRCNCRHSMSQVHKDCVLWTQVVNASEAMEKHSWPNGVTSWNDTVKFAQLVFGRDVPMENYWHRLPHASDKSSSCCLPEVHVDRNTPFVSGCRLD